MPLIEARGLTKVFRRPDKGPGFRGSLAQLVRRRFTDVVAVDQVDLSVEPGEAVAYVGPNGAGKSTTVKLLSGILVPSAGHVAVAGVVPHRDRRTNARTIGVLFGQRSQLWWDLPVRDALGLLRDMYAIPRAEYEERIEHFDEVLGLGELLPVVARKLSLGQRMRADLAAALLHRPRIVYLDEPTIGLDIAVKDRVRAFLRRLRDEGTTIILTTHDLGDIEDLCRRIVIIDHGRIIHDGALAAVKDHFARERTVHLQLATAVPESALAHVLPDAEVSRTSPTEYAIRFDRFTLTAGAVMTAVLPLAEIVDLHVDEPDIGDVVRKVYAGELDFTVESGPAR
jgi:ABC-2 type transport system ATP-binding protein